MFYKKPTKGAQPDSVGRTWCIETMYYIHNSTHSWNNNNRIIYERHNIYICNIITYIISPFLVIIITIII